MAPELPRSQAAGALKVIALQKPLQHSLTVFVLLGCVRGIELAVGPDGTLFCVVGVKDSTGFPERCASSR